MKNFDPENYAQSIMRVFKNIKITTPDLKLSKTLTAILPINYTFSQSSCDYCFSKGILLLYYQEVYTSDIKRINEIKVNCNNKLAT